MSDTMPDCDVKNHFPDMDQVTITIGDWTVNVWRDENMETHVNVTDCAEGASVDYILGKEDETFHP